MNNSNIENNSILINEELKKILNEYDKLFIINEKVMRYFNDSLAKLESKLKPINNFWKLSKETDYLYFTKSRALDILNNDYQRKSLSFIIKEFPNLDEKPLNYEFSINQDKVKFTIDLNILLDYIKSIYSDFMKEIDKEQLMNKFAEFNRNLNNQKEIFNRFNLIINNKLVIHNDFELNNDIYNDYSYYYKDLNDIFDIFSLFSFIFLELFELDNSINNNLRKSAKILTLYDK